MIASKDVAGGLGQDARVEALGLMAGRIAHDFNSLLTIELLCLDRLRGLLPAGTPGGAMLEELDRSARRGQALVRQLLTASRQEPDDLEAFDLGAAAREATWSTARALGRGVKLRTDVASTSLPIRADRAQVELAVVNLVLNARDALPGRGIIRVRTRREIRPRELERFGLARGEPCGLLTVEDTGDGIPEDLLPYVFDPFFTTKPVGIGTGLGLASVRAAAKQAGGAVAVDSRPGRGTRFTLCFPLQEPPLQIA